MHINVNLKKHIGHKKYYLQERFDLWYGSYFYGNKVQKYCYIISQLICILVLNCLAAQKTYSWFSRTKPGTVLNSVKQSDIFMCHRSAGAIQKYVRQDCILHLIYDVICVNGCIFGVSDLQPGRAAPKSAIQGPSGTFT